jgi:uncharacterized protein (DUF1501 family)
MSSRRDFIKSASCAAIGGITMGSTLLNFRTLNAALANNQAYLNNDYRAIVCILLAGGNDSYNMLAPADSTNTGSQFNVYKASRSNLAIPFANLLKSPTLTNNGLLLGLHPALPKTKQMYDSNELAFISNVGTLVEPLSNKQQVINNLKKSPIGLYSHSDQIQQWQTGIPQDRSATGWGGKIADLVNACNGSTDVSMNISLSGTNVFQSGNNSVEYTLSPTNGAVGIRDDGGTWLFPQLIKSAVDTMVNTQYADAYKKTYINVIKKSRENNALFANALASSPTYTTPFATNNDLAKSLKMIANVISKRVQLGNLKRQIFYVEYGGWDHHDEVLDRQNAMLNIVDNSLYAFNQALKQLGVFNCVTTFTMSEFGRTLTSNGNGTDHAWGGNVMVMGGDVNGGRVLGTYPTLALNSNIDLGRGVLIPSLSPDAYFGELALWLGLNPSDLPLVYPNINKFYSYAPGSLPLGFMKSQGTICY